MSEEQLSRAKAKAIAVRATMSKTQLENSNAHTAQILMDSYSEARQSVERIMNGNSTIRASMFSPALLSVPEQHPCEDIGIAMYEAQGAKNTAGDAYEYAGVQFFLALDANNQPAMIYWGEEFILAGFELATRQTQLSIIQVMWNSNDCWNWLRN